MTNGEKIKQAFPDLQIDIGELEVYMWTTAHDAIDIPLEWWNAEYKEPVIRDNGVKNELDRVKNELEPSYNSVKSKLKNPKAKTFDILHFVADNAGLSTFEAIEKAYNMGVSEQESALEQLRAEIEQKIEQEKLARSVYRYEKIDAVKAEQCTGIISAYHDVIKLIDIMRQKVRERNDC